MKECTCHIVLLMVQRETMMVWVEINYCSMIFPHFHVFIIFMNMQIRYDLHTCVLPLDERNESKPHIGSCDERTCQIVSHDLTTCNNDCLGQKYVLYFMIFLILRFSLIFMDIQFRNNLHM